MPRDKNNKGSSRREFLKRAGLAAVSAGTLPGLLGCSDSSPGVGADSGPPDGGAQDRKFMVVALPDTQHYANSYPEIFKAQTQWIADNHQKEKIAFVTHLGDIVNNGPNLRQWKNARAATDILDTAGVRYGTCLGNHDFKYSDSEYSYGSSTDGTCSASSDIDCKAQHYVDNYGPQRFAGRPWYSGASPSGQSNYQTFTAGGQRFLFLHLAVDPRAAEVSWAQKVLDQNRGAAVHVSTHRYMYDLRLVKSLPFPLSFMMGGRYTPLIYDFDSALYTKDAMEAEDLFQKFIAPNTNIFMVQCGHVDAELREVSKNRAGLPVHEILVDYQELSPKGGYGWMRLMTFDLDKGEIQVRTYSPHAKTFRKNGDSLDASLQAFQIALNNYSSYLTRVGLDKQQLQKQVDYWSQTAAGRKEFSQLLYDGGRRDSEFTLKVDFSAYPR